MEREVCAGGDRAGVGAAGGDRRDDARRLGRDGRSRVEATHAGDRVAAGEVGGLPPERQDVAGQPRPGLDCNVSPTVLREGAYRLFFFSREEPRMHVHVAHPGGEAKIWIEPEVATAVVVGLTPRQMAEAEDIVRRHLPEIRDAWIRHFGR